METIGIMITEDWGVGWCFRLGASGLAGEGLWGRLLFTGRCKAFLRKTSVKKWLTLVTCKL